MSQIARYRKGFYYGQLTIDQKIVYEKLAAAVAGFEPYLKTHAGEKDLRRVKLAVRYDNPEFFFWSCDDSRIKSGKLMLSYSCENADEAASLVMAVRQKRREIIEDLAKGDCDSVADMIAGVYDYIVNTVRYAEEELQKPDYAQWIYSIHGPLLNESGVCLGIAQTINYFCEALHIAPAIIVTGETKLAGWNGPHGWNMIKIGDEYYHLDATSEICETSEEKGRKYFMKKDADMEGFKWSGNIYPSAV